MAGPEKKHRSQDSVIDEMTTENEALARENGDLKTQLAERDAEILKLKADAEDATAKIADGRNEIEGARAEIIRLEKANEDCAAHNRAFIDQRDKATAELETALLELASACATSTKQADTIQCLKGHLAAALKTLKHVQKECDGTNPVHRGSYLGHQYDVAFHEDLIKEIPATVADIEMTLANL